MLAPYSKTATDTLLQRLLLVAICIALSCSTPFASGQVDANINKSIWKMLYGVTDAQVNSATWLAADDDGDGLSNGAELTAGTNPFKPNSTLQVATVTSNTTTVSLTFPTISKKLYTAQATASLNPLNWQAVSGLSVVGDGTSKTLVALKTAGAFFRVVVQDQSTANDQVADWAKQILGYASGSSIGSQSNYDHNTLASALASQNVVTVEGTDPSATQPADNITPASSGGVITFNRSGYQLFSTITVPILKSGTAVETTDYAALPSSVTFAPGVKSVTLNVTPLYNPSRLNSTTVTVTAQGGGGYALGSSTSAGVTIYPSGNPNGTGLTGTYYTGAAATYTNAATLGAATATYNYTQVTSTTGTAVITYTGGPAVPYTIGSLVTLSFTTGNLLNALYNGSYTVTAIGANTITVAITGGALPASGTGNVTLTPFAAATNALNFGGIATTYNYTKGTTSSGTAVISYTGTPAVAFTTGGTATLQFTSGNLSGGLYDGTYTITATTGGTGSGTLTVTITGAAVPATGTGNSTLTPFNAPALVRIDPTVDYLWNTGVPTNNVLPTATNNNWAARFDSYLLPSTTGSYFFDVQANDGARVYVNGTLVIDGWAPGSTTYTPMASAAVALTAGTRVPIRVEYYHLNGAASVNLRWEPAGSGSFSSIPTTNSFLDVTTSTNGWAATYWTNTSFFGLPRYGDYPTSITNLTWAAQPTATVANADSFSIRWDGYLAPSTKNSTVTISVATPAVVTWNAHGLTANTPVTFTTTGALPTGLTAGTTYYVSATGLATNTFQVSATPGGVVVNTTGTQSGTQTAAAATTNTYVFDVQASDGARVYLDLDQNGTFGGGETIIDAWSPADVSAVTPLTSGSYSLIGGQKYRFRVEYYEGGGNGLINLRWKIGAGSLTAIPLANVVRADPTTGAATTTTGLWASYYNNVILADPPLYSAQDTSSSTITIAYGAGKPAAGSLGTAASNNWSGRFDTYLKATAGVGNYQFQLVAQSAGRLVVNNTEVIPFTAGTSTSTLVSLAANQVVPLRVEFYDIASSGSAVLNWKTPGAGSFVLVPTANFFLDAGATNAGVAGTYWANTDFAGAPYFADYQTQINYSVGSGQPSKTWAVTDFSATWDGYLSPTTTGSFLFDVQAQNQARVYINGTLVIDAWTTPDSSAITPMQSAPISLTAGVRVPIHVDYANTAGAGLINVRWKTPTASSFAAIPAANVLRDATTSQQGLLATYYNNSTLTAPFFYQVAENNTTAITYNFGAGRPDPTLPFDNFTVRWTGQILPQYTEPYFFTVKSDDGARLWVNGRLIIDRWQSGSAEPISAPINLQAGIFYDIKLEYMELTSSAEAHLNWYSSDQAKQIVPMARLFPATTGAAPAAASGVTSPTSDVYLLGSGTPYTYTIAGSNTPSTYSASGLPPGLALNGNTISGTPSQAGHYQFTVTTTNSSGSSSVVVDLDVAATTGNITREIWNGLAGANISDIPLTQAPSSTNTTLTTLEDAVAYSNNTGERLRGYFTAPTTGNYYFWVAASNAAELWISNDNQAVNKVRRASVAGPTGSGARTWDAQSTQRSPWLSLVAGQNYYFEVLHNTGASGSSSHLSVAWFLDPTGNSVNPIANGSGPASASAAGIVPSYGLSAWDNPPTTTVSGTVYITDLQGVSGLSNIKANGGAFLRVNGSTAVVHLNYSGLTSGAISRRIYAAPVGNNPPQLLFDLDAQDKNYSNLKTSDEGYTWNMQGSDLTALNNASVYLSVATMNNPNGELAGTFGKVTGSQAAPMLPSYPSWTDDHSTNDASNSRFLTQATYGPSPSDMSYVKANGYRPWIENQFSLAATHHVPYVLGNLTNDPQNPYNDTLTFNAWWKNSVTAPDQLRQRVAFALSEILVVSDTGPLNNNGRTLSDYYDTLLDYGLDNFRNLLKQVTLTSAMGVYLDMRGNDLGNLSTGLHPNENYAREIMQLFSVGLYRRWPDGTLVLDSNGNAIATYDQTVITGMARVFTGWNWGQALSAGRLPTSFGPASNYLDPMVLVPTHHELGTKILLDNVLLPAAVVTSQTNTSYDPNPNPITIQSTDPALGAGNLVSAPITSTYDLNGLRDLEAALDNIVNNTSVGPYICRQLIQRLVTSNPKPEYVYRVVRAFNGERNIDGVATGVRGDMKDVIRAILLDPEARSATAAADPGFGKQREHLLRVTGPARAFPTTSIPNCTYRELGGQPMVVTTPTVHRLVNGDTVFLNTFVDGGSSTTNQPSTQGYSVGNTTPAYSFDKTTGKATITAPGYQLGDSVSIQFTSGNLAVSPYNVATNYTAIAPVTSTTFTVQVAAANAGPTTGSGNTLMPNNFTVNNGSISTPTYAGTTTSVVITASGYTAGHSVYVAFSSGGLAGGTYDKAYNITSATATTFTITLSGSPPATSSGSTLIPRFSGGYTVTTSGNVSTITLQVSGNHNLNVGDQVQLDFLVPLLPLPAASGIYMVTGTPGSNLFTVTTSPAITNGNQSTTGMVAYPLANSPWTRSGTATLNFGTWNMGASNSDIIQTPLNSATVFNFYYPDYQYPGPMAQAGMTTPEFQLTNDSNTMNLTNVITAGILNAGNTNGFTSFRGGNGVIAMDLAPYMTTAQTSNAGVPALVDSISTLLTSGNLNSATRTTIINYVANTTNFPLSATPTNQQMRDRVRAIVHLIVTSAEYAIQK